VAAPAGALVDRHRGHRREVGLVTSRSI
jgi:hypothetical protein